MPYKAMFDWARRIALFITPLPREVFNAVEDEQQFKNALTALTACSKFEVEALLPKKHL